MARNKVNNEILTEYQKVIAIDALLPFIEEHEYFSPNTIWIANKEKIDEALPLDQGVYPEWKGLNEAFINRQIASFDYRQSGDSFLLTDYGREVKKQGGIIAMKLKQEKDLETDRKRQALSDKKLQMEVVNLTRIKKTYWWTFAFSIIALIISAGLLFAKLLEKKPPL